MIRFFKWFNNKIETSAWWLAGYCLILRIVLGNVFYSMSDQIFYTFAIILWIVLSFLAIKLTLRFYEKKLPNYSFFQLALNIVYIIIAPITMIYFLLYHPLLGTLLWLTWYVFVGIIFNICNHFEKKKQA